MRLQSKPLLGGCLLAAMTFAGTRALAGDLRLAEAVKRGDRKVVVALLQQRADVNAAFPDGATALLWAVYQNDSETAELLIRAGADVNAANEYGVAPLILVATNGNTALIESLLKAGANANVANMAGLTPLMEATRAGSVQVVQALLAKGAHVNAAETGGGQTALMWAAAEKHPEVARVLIAHGADIQARSKEGFTPLLFAAQQGDMQTVQLLLDAGADVNESMPLRKFAPQGERRVLYLPRKEVGGEPGKENFAAGSVAGAVADTKVGLPPAADPRTGLTDQGAPFGSAAGMTPLLLASASGHEELALHLIERGADAKAADANGTTALHFAFLKGLAYLGGSYAHLGANAYLFRPHMMDLAKALLARGAKVNAQLTKDSRLPRGSSPRFSLAGATPFTLATASMEIPAMKFLLANGADPMLGMNNNTTPLMVIAGLGYLDVQDRTKQQWASALEAVKMLVELGADVNAVGDNGFTALHGAAYVGAGDIIKYLVSKGAKLEALDKFGQTPLSIAEGVITTGIVDFSKKPHGPHKPTADLLLSLGAIPLEKSGVERVDVQKAAEVIR
ncbi:MAG: ankyrin repeat domain-containing protein [Acidobacteria bacterium]|nr:ankyrin repeat domain-containing protein [Acidobacteriota bacterium]